MSPDTKGLLGREILRVATRSSGDLNCRGARPKELSSPCSILRVLTGVPVWGLSTSRVARRGVVGRVYLPLYFIFCIARIHYYACYLLRGGSCCATCTVSGWSAYFTSFRPCPILLTMYKFTCRAGWGLVSGGERAGGSQVLFCARFAAMCGWEHVYTHHGDMSHWVTCSGRQKCIVGIFVRRAERGCIPLVSSEHRIVGVGGRWTMFTPLSESL
jgi:hypothetical protein